MRKSFIYLITNLVNGRMYVGQTVYPKKRWVRHCHGDKQVIDKAIDKYSKDCFLYEILEVCSVKEADKKEIEWIKKYNTFEGRGYNCHVGGNAMRGKNNPMYGLLGKDNPRYGQKHTLESRLKISKNHHDVSGKNNPMYGVKRPDTSKRVSGMNNPHAKITKEIGNKIYNEYKNNKINQYELAKKYNTAQSVVSRIVNHKHWTTKDLKRG
jgi:group I intron endonuclease